MELTFENFYMKGLRAIASGAPSVWVLGMNLYSMNSRICPRCSFYYISQYDMAEKLTF